MARWRDTLARWAAVAALSLLASCGGGGSTSSTTAVNDPVSVPLPGTLAANQVVVVADQGIDGSAINSPFVTVTVCAPGTSGCQTIDHVLVDTSSYGLRIAASALTGAAVLPTVAAPDGNPLAECASFVSGFAWGSVRSADVKVGGETAANLPVQVVNDTAAAYATVPAACSSTGSNFGVGAGAKGIIGLGFLAQDCGATCVTSTAPQVYFSCPMTGCVATTAPLASQVANPVASFATDNNGVALVMPAVPLGGVPGATGLLTFGVGTQSNNQLGSAQVFTVDASGYFRTTYQGRTLNAFIDSGSNGIFLHDASIPTCSSGFYCPSSTLSLTATATGLNGTSRDVPFSVENVTALPASTAAAHLAGDIGLSTHFDWGLPFFFGRTVFVAMKGAATPWGTGPYWAF
jgi:hypothetical protein